MNLKNFIKQEFKKKYFKNILYYIKKRIKQGYRVFPPKNLIFRAFSYFNKFEDIKVVIVGQDPYCYYDQADGLAFSVNKNTKMPPSLINIFREIKNEFNKFKANHGCLDNWSKQGVLLLNKSLTVEYKSPNSHSDIGWNIFTNKIIKYISKLNKNTVFLLWGKNAQESIKYIKNYKNNKIMISSHPSPKSVKISFYGCNHFIKTNNFLEKIKKKAIDWNIY
ncbi:MAG: uracil-DNA glycosylase [Enterobacteriaceae bacterium]